MEDDGVWIERLLPKVGAGAMPWEANKFAYALYGASLFPDYFPCSLSCDGTIRLTRKALLALREHGLSALADRHAERMRAPIAVLENRLVGLFGISDTVDWRPASASAASAPPPSVPFNRTRCAQWSRDTFEPFVLHFQ